MINVLWVNFGGISSPDRGPLWECKFDLRVATLQDNRIGDPVSLCDCGEMKVCKADLVDKHSYRTDLKGIKFNGSKIDFGKFSYEFYEVIHKLIKEKFPDSFHSGRNMALFSEEKPDFGVIVKDFLTLLNAMGFEFTSTTTAVSDPCLLQLGDSEKSRFSSWIKEVSTPAVESSLSPT